jgi:hypothetical protein
MQEIKKANNNFELNWVYIITIITLAGGAIGFLCWAITSPMLDQTQKAHYEQLGWNWNNILLFDIGLISCFIALIVKVYFDLKVEYDEFEIKRPSLKGLKIIKWADVEQIKQVQYGLHLVSMNEKIVISPFAYKDPGKVMEIIKGNILKYKNPSI